MSFSVRRADRPSHLSSIPSRPHPTPTDHSTSHHIKPLLSATPSDTAQSSITCTRPALTLCFEHLIRFPLPCLLYRSLSSLLIACLTLSNTRLPLRYRCITLALTPLVTSLRARPSVQRPHREQLPILHSARSSHRAAHPPHPLTGHLPCLASFDGHLATHSPPSISKPQRPPHLSQ